MRTRDTRGGGYEAVRVVDVNAQDVRTEVLSDEDVSVEGVEDKK